VAAELPYANEQVGVGESESGCASPEEYPWHRAVEVELGMWGQSDVSELYALIDEYDQLVEEIEELEAEAAQMRQSGEKASDETCGMPQLVSKDDTTLEKLIKIIGNTSEVDPKECVAGDTWRKTMEARADTFEAEEIQPLRERRDQLQEQIGSAP